MNPDRERLADITCQKLEARFQLFNADFRSDRAAVEWDIARLSDETVSALLEYHEKTAAGYVW